MNSTSPLASQHTWSFCHVDRDTNHHTGFTMKGF